MSWERRRVERAVLIAALLWLAGIGLYGWLGAWRQSGELYVIDETGARAVSEAAYNERKASREFAGTTPQSTPEGVRYVVSNVSLPKFRADTQRHLRMVRFNHEEQGWFKFIRGMTVAVVPLVLMLFYQLASWTVRRKRMRAEGRT